MEAVLEAEQKERERVAAGADEDGENTVDWVTAFDECHTAIEEFRDGGWKSIRKVLVSTNWHRNKDAKGQTGQPVYTKTILDADLTSFMRAENLRKLNVFAEVMHPLLQAIEAHKYVFMCAWVGA